MYNIIHNATIKAGTKDTGAHMPHTTYEMYLESDCVCSIGTADAGRMEDKTENESCTQTGAVRLKCKE